MLVTWLWGSGGVGRMSAGGASAVRAEAASGPRTLANPLRGARWYHPAAHGERDAADDPSCRRQPTPRRPPLPATPSAPSW